MTPKLVVRVDGSREVGFGHAVRSLALIQAWLDNGGTASVVSACLPGPVRQTLLEEGVQIIALPSVGATPDPLLELFEQADWVVFDSYLVPAKVRELARERCPHTGMIDDFAHSTRPVNVDLLIDQNLGVHPGNYLDDSIETLLLGTRYALLRRFFRSTPSPCPQTRTGELRILILTGGSMHSFAADTFRRVADNLSNQGHHVTTVGKGLKSSGFDFSELPRLMIEADLAISAAGTTCWELTWSGTPFVAVPLAENQIPIATRLAEVGVADALNPGAKDLQHRLSDTIVNLINDPARRHDMANNGHNLVDGLGAERVVDKMFRTT